MSEWKLRLVDYWDQNIDAINTQVLRLSQLEPAERDLACTQISQTVAEQLAHLSDRQVQKAAVSMVDDLYKYVNDQVLMHTALLAYLDAVARTLITTLHQRGYQLHYVVENQFSGAEFILRGPCDLFPRIFQAAGLVYICPHALAWQLMQADGVIASDYAALIVTYLDEARGLANRLVRQCQVSSRSLIFLEVDYQHGALDEVLAGSGMPGVLSVIRQDAPLPGSTVAVRFPE